MNAHDKSRTRYYYARFAFMCGQWQAFKNQIKIIRDSEGTLNTSFFGGDEVFNKMIERADSPSVEN